MEAEKRDPGNEVGWQSDLTYLVDQKNGDRMIKQLLNSAIAEYRDLSVSRRSIICLSRSARH